MPGFWKAVREAVSPIYRPAATEIAGINPAAWNSPQQPLRPILAPGLGVRSWDFQPGINLQFTPRGDSPINFAQLRNVANSFDLCRLMIETSKDQIVNRPWLIRVKVNPGETKAARADREAKNTNIAKLTAFFQRPDGAHAWPVWLRMWLDQLLTYDAPCIYPVRNVLGEPLGLRIISGTTITPLVDNDGFIPAPPAPAYQQIILGLPTANLQAGSSKVRELTASQLIYSPRNPRVDSRWGYGPVEQIITTLAIGANRQQFLKAYYTDGNVPEGIMPMPESWTMQQIKDFQNWFDSLMAGNLGKKRRLIAVPDSKQPIQFSKETALTDVTDDYLIRVVAFAFSISPQNLIKQVNRGTAKESSDVAQMEGREPLMKHIESVMNLDVIQGLFGITDCEFAYADEREMDPLKQAQTDDIYVGKVKTINEARNDLGLDPRPEPEADMLGEFTPQGFVPLGQQLQQQSAGDAGGTNKPAKKPTAKVKKNSEIRIVGGTLAPVSELKRAEMEKLCAEFLAAAGKRAAETLSRSYGEFAKAEKTDDQRIQEILAGLEIDWALLGKDVIPLLQAAALAGVDIGQSQVYTASRTRSNPAGAKSHALAYAEERGAELVGMKRQADGSFVTNPDAMWAISDTTREDLRETLALGFKEGWTIEQLASVIEGAYAFSSDRASMIAKTEVTRAQAQGNLGSWIKSKVILLVAWQLSADHDEANCDICDEFAEQGDVEPGHEFAPGVTAPGAHPNCNCALVVRKVKGKA